MSRIIKSIFNSAIHRTKINNTIVFLSNTNNQNILNLNTNLYSINNLNHDKIKKIDDNIVNQCLAFLPDIVICENMVDYPNAKNLCSVLRLPQVNIITELIPVKPDMMLGLAREQLINDINLIANKDIAKKMYISNYEILSTNLEQQILDKVNEWKSV